MSCQHPLHSNPPDPRSVPAFLPQPLTTIDNEDLPVGRWAILADVAGFLHVTCLWDYQSHPVDGRVLLWSLTKSVYADDEDADHRDFFVEAHDTKDAATYRAHLLGDAYIVCRHHYGSRYHAEAPARVLRAWQAMYELIWTP